MCKNTIALNFLVVTGPTPARRPQIGADPGAASPLKGLPRTRSRLCGASFSGSACSSAPQRAVCWTETTESSAATPSCAKTRSTRIPASSRGPRQHETLEPRPTPARRGSELSPVGGCAAPPCVNFPFPDAAPPLHERLARTPFERIRLLRRFPVVEIQETAQSLPARDTPTSRANVLVRNN
ncbi:MAG: hypothetical protein ACI9OJ_001117 [Myxococcota bacterium]